jgi:FKBP-type peptidyl-prolyl cis-trans isomerase FkpA
MMKFSLCYITVVFLVVYQSCSGRKEPNLTEQEIRETENALIGANRLLVKMDHDKIISYIDSKNLDMKETSSGLWYTITPGSGRDKNVQFGMLVTIKYRVSLLNGNICYDSDSLGVKQFVVGRGGVESGLEEGILLLKQGDKAMFIMPPHLAQGLQGDGNKIPPRAIIVYDVDLLKAEF